MRKKNLLATDFSKNAFNAIAYVLSIYKNERCDFFVLITYSAPRYLKDSLLVSESAQDKFAKAIDLGNNLNVPLMIMHDFRN